MAPAPNMALPPDKTVQAHLLKPCLCPAHPKERSHLCHRPFQAKKRHFSTSSLTPTIQVRRDKSGHHRIQGHKVAEHTRLHCAHPSSVLSHLQYLPVTAHSALFSWTSSSLKAGPILGSTISQSEEHHGATVSSDRSPQHAAPEVSVRTLRGWKNYREAHNT